MARRMTYEDSEPVGPKEISHLVREGKVKELPKKIHISAKESPTGQPVDSPFKLLNAQDWEAAVKLAGSEERALQKFNAGFNGDRRIVERRRFLSELKEPQRKMARAKNAVKAAIEDMVARGEAKDHKEARRLLLAQLDRS
jgi:hypothetical protein